MRLTTGVRQTTYRQSPATDETMKQSKVLVVRWLSYLAFLTGTPLTAWAADNVSGVSRVLSRVLSQVLSKVLLHVLSQVLSKVLFHVLPFEIFRVFT